ncbi:T9SS type A sorting domain-containing protein, partial [candidate division KSB1 bacterium]|nr:T9SS type A sorting domain-containing protein [candidate division KSB1 bacterium]
AEGSGEFSIGNFGDDLLADGSTSTPASFNCLSGLKISGTVSYYMDSTAVIDSVMANLTGDATLTNMTLSTGYYEFTDLASGNYSVSASRARRSWMQEPSISAFDASYILRYYVNTLTLSEAQKIAADASGDGSISPFDASIVLRYLVGIDVLSTEIANWKFVVPPVTDWLVPVTARSYAPLSSDQADQNFDGILIGDVTGNFPGSVLAKAGNGNVVPGEMKSLTDNILELPVRIEGVSAYSAVGFELKIDKEQLKVENVTLEKESENVLLSFYEQNGTFRVAVASALQRKDTDLLRITFKNISKANMNDVKLQLTGYEIDANRVDAPQEWMVALQKQPEQFDLKPNYPNPFNSETVFEYQIPINSKVEMIICNVAGQKIKTLVNEKKQAGFYRTKWDGTNVAGGKVSSGLYFCRIQAGHFHKTIRVMLLK